MTVSGLIITVTCLTCTHTHVNSVRLRVSVFFEIIPNRFQALRVCKGWFTLVYGAVCERSVCEPNVCVNP